jgi:hypothetical protein
MLTGGVYLLLRVVELKGMSGDAGACRFAMILGRSRSIASP